MYVYASVRGCLLASVRASLSENISKPNIAKSQLEQAPELCNMTFQSNLGKILSNGSIVWDESLDEMSKISCKG